MDLVGFSILFDTVLIHFSIRQPHTSKPNHRSAGYTTATDEKLYTSYNNTTVTLQQTGDRFPLLVNTGRVDGVDG